VPRPRKVLNKKKSDEKYISKSTSQHPKGI
jgi:hypothetical protein